MGFLFIVSPKLKSASALEADHRFPFRATVGDGAEAVFLDAFSNLPQDTILANQIAYNSHIIVSAQ
jgi:hypothetical protein